MRIISDGKIHLAALAALLALFAAFGGATPFTQTAALAQSPGGRIAFESDRDGNYNIYAMNADGSGVVRLTNNSDDDRYPSWSPDGRRIAFYSRRDGNSGIYAMNADGSGVVRLTRGSHPSWSPDGRRIAFDRGGEIYAMNADGSGVVHLTDNSADDEYPSWSPDGRRIAFVSDRDGNDEIYAMNADGSGVVRLTNNSAYDVDPSWSPDGRRIAFVSYRDGNAEIYAMNADGSGRTNLTNNSAYDVDPSWSPDGRRIAFATYGVSSISAMNADGSGVTRLTNNSAVDRSPSWAPAAAPAPSDDHGDSLSSATRISVDSSVKGVIGMSSDVDTFWFQAKRGTYTIETSIPSGSGVDTVIGIWDANGSLLDEDDDGGDGHELASRIVWTAPRSATYYVVVESFSTGGYRLLVSSGGASDDHGDSRSSATGISVDSRVNGVIETSSDVDTFSFRAKSGRTYTIETSIQSDSGVDTVIGIWDANGSLLDEDDDGGDGHELASKIVWTAPSSATYYVVVEGFSTGGYRLLVSSSGATPTPTVTPTPTITPTHTPTITPTPAPEPPASAPAPPPAQSGSATPEPPAPESAAPAPPAGAAPASAPVPPAEPPARGGGIGCGLPASDVSAGAAAANALFLLGPLGLTAALKIRRRRSPNVDLGAGRLGASGNSTQRRRGANGARRLWGGMACRGRFASQFRLRHSRACARRALAHKGLARAGFEIRPSHKAGNG